MNIPEKSDWDNYRIHVIAQLDGLGQKADRVENRLLDRIDKLETRLDVQLREIERLAGKNSNRITTLETKSWAFGALGGFIVVAITQLIFFLLKINI